MKHRQYVPLPEDFPNGTKYVVAGKNDANGKLHVSERYVVFPDGRRVDLPLNAIVAPPLSPREVLAKSRRRVQGRLHRPARPRPVRRPARAGA
jgi:hypothetical protein